MAEMTRFHLIRTFEKIRTVLSLDDESFARLLGIELAQFEELKLSEILLEPQHIYSISTRLNLSADDIFSGDIDYEALKDVFKNNSFTLPKKYEIKNQKLSTVRGIRTIIQFIRNFYDDNLAKVIFSKFQVCPDDFLTCKHKYISSHLSNDILIELKNFGFSNTHFILMGQETFNTMKGNLKEHLSDQSTPAGVYSCLVEEVIPLYYDNLMDYKIEEIYLDRAIVSMCPSEMSFDIFQDSVPFGRELEYYLKGAFSSILKTISPFSADVKSLVDFSKYSKKSIFEVSWNGRLVSRWPTSLS